MALDGILTSGLTAVMTNTAALRVTSANIANINTPGYVRRVVQQETLAPGGRLAGVGISEIKRVVSNYLDREVLTASANAARYDVQSAMMNQLNVALGAPGDGNSLGSQLDKLYSSLSQASLDPSSLALRLGALNQFDTLGRSVAELSEAVHALRSSADQQISGAVSETNAVIKELFELNAPIQRSFVNGDTASGLLDQRDQLVRKLSDLVGIRTVQQTDGRLFIATTDGVQLIGDTYAQLSDQPSAGPSFKPITIQTMNALTGLAIGNPATFDPHAGSGQLRGLLDLRDSTLVGIGQELGTMGQMIALTLNKQHNANSAVPPPATLTGRQTGLVGTDALNFSGIVTVGIANSSGALTRQVAINFGAGTLSVNGGGTVGIGSTIQSFATALNTALGGSGSASFANGVMTLSANGGNGLVVADDAGTPSSRAGLGFSHFFGLNDLYTAEGNSILTTGLTTGATADFAPGGSISMMLKGPKGERVNEVAVGVTGTTIGDMIGALNTAFTGKASFALDANGQLQITKAAAYTNYQVEVVLDTTARGTTGESFSTLFGMGTGEAMARGLNFGLAAGIAGNPQSLAFAKSSLNTGTALGTVVVTPGDNRGLLALQNSLNQPQSFAASGALPARSVTLSDYAAAFYQDVATRSELLDSAKMAQDTRLELAEQNQSQAEGVNLDEELSRMLVLQQAYNAGARLIKVSKDLYDELLNAVDR